MVKCRFLVLIISVASLAAMISNSLALNFTVICMDDVASGNETDHWIHSPTQVNLLFSMCAVGGLLGTVAITHLTQRIGLRGLATIYGMLSAIATMLFPLSVDLGYAPVVVLRILQGISTCLTYPMSGLVSSQWSTPTTRGTFLSVMTSDRQFSTMFTMPVSGYLCETALGWRSVYYLHGIVSLLIFVLFFVCYRDDPKEHRFISAEEVEEIQQGKGNQKVGPVHYRAILTDFLPWSIWISGFGILLGFQIFFIYGPTYVNKVLGLDVRSTGWATAFPCVLCAISKCTMGPISDRATFISEKGRLMFFGTVALWFSAISFATLALTESVVLAQIAYIVAVVSNGLNAIGTLKCAQIVYRQHVHFVMSGVALLQSIIALVGPMIVAFLCPKNTPEQWSRMFIYIACLMAACSIPFILTVRSKPAECTKISEAEPIPEKKISAA